MLDVEVAGAPVRLLAQRAAFLPDAATLLVADAHIGKAVSFRRLGVPVPRGTTTETLRALDALLDATAARRIVFLGDLLHARRGRSETTWAAVADWRARHAEVELVLVRGNHDRHAGDPPREWRIDVVGSALRVGPFALTHHPQPLAGAYVLAGHLHPAVVVGAGWERLRLPCFHFGSEVGVLPAFGAFTGMHVIQPGPEDRVYAIAGDAVRPLHSSP